MKFLFNSEGGDGQAFARLWLGFMTARVMVASMLLVMQVTSWMIGPALTAPSAPGWPIAVCLIYLGICLAVRLLAKPGAPGKTFDIRWVTTIGIDLAVYALLELAQPASITYWPLFALPVLLASVLGSALLALGTAAAATLLMLAEAWWLTVLFGGDTTPRYLQSGLTGTGFFMVALLANQLATRLAKEEQAARASQAAARLQTRVNELVVENLADGILVVDGNGIVRAANPAARRLLGRDAAHKPTPFVLAAEPAWAPLVELTQTALAGGAPAQSEVVIEHAHQGPTHLHARTRLTAAGTDDAQALCVVFLEDLRETEARVRTEKLAAMGRMSAAVAHEIRNPLAAITQANALLEEDLRDPHARQLTGMIGQNARRLARIVEDVLDVSRVHDSAGGGPREALRLADTVLAICTDWVRQHGVDARLAVVQDAQVLEDVVRFDADHLRRVLINLLDNALRYASTREGAIRVEIGCDELDQPTLAVWSDGPPLESSVLKHLFEPFFSSQSRSSGLGLYICRELCTRHGATIGYLRRARGPVDGNEFLLTLQHAPATSRPAGGTMREHAAG